MEGGGWNGKGGYPAPIICGIKKDSPARKAGLKIGDRLELLNGRRVESILDYFFLSSTTDIVLQYIRQDRRYIARIKKREEEPLGLEFPDEIFDGIRTCQNHCAFCFVDQLPPGMRKSLYLKDDDYRLSFLHGNFITLSNLEDADWQKIKEYRLSPLYISVHSTSPELRSRLFASPEAAEIMEQLRVLSSWRIELHLQIVICPGLNDGGELDRTLGDLSTIAPASIALVPVGITKTRKETRVYSPVGPGIALEICRKAAHWQRFFRRTLGRTTLFLADEFYLLAGLPLPPYSHYDEFPQLENGVGMIKKLWSDFARSIHKFRRLPRRKRSISFVTSGFGRYALEPLLARLKKEGVDARLHVVKNNFFGRLVQVAGLLTGGDILDRLRGELTGDVVLVPASALKDGYLFLDDLSLHEMEETLGKKTQAARPEAFDLLEKIWQDL